MRELCALLEAYAEGLARKHLGSRRTSIAEKKVQRDLVATVARPGQDL